MLEQQLEQDLKAALLSGNRDKATVLRGLKSSLLYAKVANGTRDQQMTDEEIIAVFGKEAKKRQESADLYRKGGDEARAEAELAEKAIIDAYLPEQLSEKELAQVVDAAITELDAHDTSMMGKVIGAVKTKTAGKADGSAIAKMVRERLQ